VERQVEFKFVKIVTKPWGREEWLELNDRYCYKRIYINAGHKTSFQYHNFKRETNYLIDGKAEVWLENDSGVVEKKIIVAGDYFNVTPPKKHRVIAITDIILQEVSTPEVDDVIRIEDDSQRGDGRIEAEHQNPALLILSAGLGSRLKENTKSKNKALVPINNKAAISHIIDQFPDNCDIVIAVGYKKESLTEYCKLAHKDRNITFIEVDQWEYPNIGPGHSALKCAAFLQRPFFITTADCLLDGKVHSLNGNWVGVHKTSYPEKYATIDVDDRLNVKAFANKSVDGFDYAFIGVAAVTDYRLFWSELSRRAEDTELISAWANPSLYKDLCAKELKWFDTGNLDDIEKALDHFGDTPLSAKKDNEEITYKVGDILLKFCPDQNINKNKSARFELLNSFGVMPSGFVSASHFISYSWVKGLTLYECNSVSIFQAFLGFLEKNLQDCKKWSNNTSAKSFYFDKTNSRVASFEKKYGCRLIDSDLNINGSKFSSLRFYLDGFDFESLLDNPMYACFHGDLQFDNVIYNFDSKKFTYIDWRESFSGCVDGGDIYYDLAKLYGGLLIPYNKFKDDSWFKISESKDNIKYSYNVSKQVEEFIPIYESWIVKNGYDLKKIKSIVALIYINMSPLHSDKLNKILLAKGIELLNHASNR